MERLAVAAAARPFPAVFVDGSARACDAEEVLEQDFPVRMFVVVNLRLELRAVERAVAVLDHLHLALDRAGEQVAVQSMRGTVAFCRVAAARATLARRFSDGQPQPRPDAR
jgi:hypothetical protein